MDIAEFNALPPAEAAQILLTAANIPHWAHRVVAGRPYPDAAAAVHAATSTMKSWSAADVEAAMADHPRIGEKHPSQGPSAHMSASEQAGVDRGDTEILSRLAEGNRRYEERFGRIYLVRAKGRSADELLALLQERLHNTPEAELEVTRGELIQIATLRLEATFA